MRKTVGWLCFISIGSVALASGQENLPHPEYPASALLARHDGAVLVLVTFSRSGKASDCHIVRSTASPGLDAYTRSFIEQNWRSQKLAGRQSIGVIHYAFANESPDDLASPAHCPGIPTRDGISVSVTFDHYGFVAHAEITSTSGSPIMDKYTLSWIRTHWQHDAYADQTLECAAKLQAANVR